MATTSAEPAGYCPHCGYRIDPGRCPECGQLVAPQRLAALPPHLRLRRTIRRLCIPAVLLLILVGLYGVYRYANWHRWVPNDIVLLMCPDVGWGGVWHREIERRYLAGDLSDQQRRRMFEKAVRTSFRDQTPSPYPAAVALPSRVVIYASALQFTPLVRWRADWTVYVDGHPALVLEAPDGPMPSFDLEFDLSNLKPGDHDISVSGNAWLTQSESADAPVEYSWPISLAKTVRIEDRPVNEFARPVRSPETAKRLTEFIFARTWRTAGDSSQAHFSLESWIDRVPVAAELWFRPSGGGPYRRLSEVRSYDNSVRIPTASSWVSGYAYPITDVETVSHIDVKLVPSAKVALTAGFTSYADYIVEWMELPLDHPDADSWMRPVPPQPTVREPRP